MKDEFNGIYNEIICEQQDSNLVIDYELKKSDTTINDFITIDINSTSTDQSIYSVANHIIKLCLDKQCYTNQKINSLLSTIQVKITNINPKNKYPIYFSNKNIFNNFKSKIRNLCNLNTIVKYTMGVYAVLFGLQDKVNPDVKD